MKSLKVLDQKLQLLAEAAEFDVTINSVVGRGIRHPADAVAVARRARGLHFSTTAGIIHDGGGQLVPLEQPQRAALEEVVALGDSTFDYANYNRFQRNLAEGRPNEWHCRAGSRYLYICEDGLVHWCSQQRGHPGTPLAQYGAGDLRREYHRVKGCAPFCTVGCVHRVAQVDELRQDPELALLRWFSARAGGMSPRLPRSVRLLLWVFVRNPWRDVFRRVALRIVGVPSRRPAVERD